MELGDTELSALKTYFQRIGLQLPNENLVVVIKNKQDSRAEREKQFSEIKRNKDKWQHIYEKYKEKYQNQSNIDFLSPDAQSTPKIPEQVSRMFEKSSQTSLVKNNVKGTQVESSTTQQSSKECQVTVDRGTLSSKHSNEVMEIFQNQSEVAESFEFIAGSMQQKKRKSDTPSSSSACKSDGSKSEQSEDSTRKNSVSSLPIANDDISNFDDSLKVAIALLNSLLESRHMKPELKRNLAGKVIQKIVQIQTSRSIQTSTLGSSGIYPLSQSSRAVSEAAKSVKEASIKEVSTKNSSSSSGRSREAVLKDCFKPMTQSEQKYQHSVDEEPTKGSSKNIPKDQLMDYVKREKLSHLKWIEKEIDHLRNLRDLLKRNDTPISIEENCPIYENLSLLMKARNSKENSKRDEVPEKPADPIKPVTVPSAPGTSDWNSHANTKKGSGKHRSKLETPEVGSHDESLASFIDNKSRKFLEKYENHQKAYEDVNIYTRPYSGGSKKLMPDTRVVKSKSGSRKTLQTATKDVQTSTSLASSSVFESSDSISVPVNTNTKTSTTHYRTETFGVKEKKSSGARMKLKYAETQTTDSICRTKPIFEAKTSDDVNFGTTSTTHTLRFKRSQNDKQLQTNPPSIKYTLTFDKKSRSGNVRSYLSLPQRGNTDYVSKSSKDIYNQINSATLDNRHSEDKENFDADTVMDDDDEVDLQSCLNHNRPDIFTRVEERKRCIAELKKLR